MATMNIYRGTELWLTIKTDDNTRHIRQVLGEDIIKSTFSSNLYLDINIGDFTVYNGVVYHINNKPNVKKNATNSYDYEVTFESESYELLKTQFLDLDGNSDFSLVGNVEDFIDLIITNMNREHANWARGACDQTNTSYKLLTFSKNNCMQVLQKLCEEFEGEFYFDYDLYFEEPASLPYKPAAGAVIGYKPAAEAEHNYKPAEMVLYYNYKDICFTDKAGEASGLTFLYKQGLRNIQRTTLSDKNIVTRLYAFGARKNLSSDYRDHSMRLKFVYEGKSYLENNVDKYGVIEHTEIFDDVFPHRTGEITYVSEASTIKFVDNAMDFNLNDYLLPGITAKVHFNSGDLGGYEFEVSAYNHSTKEFTIIAFTDDQGYTMPNDTLKPAIGDKYVLTDIKMPQTYIDAAEAELLAKAQTYLADNCNPRVTYILEPDWRYFKTHLISLQVGDFITIQDTDLGIDTTTRIVELTQSLANEYKYTLKLTDNLEVQLIQRLYSETEDLKHKIEVGEGGDIIRARRNWRTSEELRNMIYDTDGYFDTGNIKPESIETSMLSVGTKSTQFILKGVEIEANYQSDVSKFHASGGSLIHLSIDDDAVRTWTLSENTQTSLVDATAYYIYAKCTKEAGYTGQIVVDENQIKFDEDPTYYYFLIGVLHSVVDDVRGISLTYGQTIINGKFIRTGKIESTDGNTFFDLDNGEIQGKIKYSSGQYYSKVFRQATAPTTGMVEGDLWIDTSDGDKPHTYNGSIWVQAYTVIDGGNIETGSISAGALNISNLADIANLQLGATGYIRTAGKESFTDTTPGFWLGYDGAYKFSLGDSANYIKWNGSTLNIKGTLDVSSLAAINATLGSVSSGTISSSQLRLTTSTSYSIYFTSSGMYVYDGYSAHGAPSVTFYKSGLKRFGILLGSAGSGIYSETKLALNGGGTEVSISGGVMTLPNLGSNPTGQYGGICMVGGQLKYWNGSSWVNA